jgi:hypothetical protein
MGMGRLKAAAPEGAGRKKDTGQGS